MNFLNEGGNILLTLRGDLPTPPALSSLLAEFDIYLPYDRTSTVLDHFNYDVSSSSERHDVLLLPQLGYSRPGVRSYFTSKGLLAMPRPVAQELGSRTPLLESILRAQQTSYTYSQKEETEYSEDPFTVGEQISLVSAMQARNSARFTVFGSYEALQDQWFNAQVKLPGGSAVNTDNRDFARKVTEWTFQETGVLQVGRVEHHFKPSASSLATATTSLSQNVSNPPIYRIKNDVVRKSLTESMQIVANSFRGFRN